MRAPIGFPAFHRSISPEPYHDMNDPSPIACDLTAIEDDERAAHEEAAEAVFDAIDGLRELPDGYAFRLPPETRLVSEAGTFISRERLCCPFFRFSLEVTPEHGPVWLKLTGRDGVKEFVEEAVLPHWELDKLSSEPTS